MVQLLCFSSFHDDHLKPNLGTPCAQDFRPPSGELLKKIDAQFKSLDNFKTTFSATSAAVQGSGWGWLGYNKGTDRLEIVTMPNQDPLSMTVCPFLRLSSSDHIMLCDPVIKYFRLMSIFQYISRPVMLVLSPCIIRAWFHSWGLTSGSMPITSTTRTYALIT